MTGYVNCLLQRHASTSTWFKCSALSFKSMLKIPFKFPLSDHENVGDLAEDGNVQRNVQSFKTLVLSHCSAFCILCFAVAVVVTSVTSQWELAKSQSESCSTKFVDKLIYDWSWFCDLLFVRKPLTTYWRQVVEISSLNEASVPLWKSGELSWKANYFLLNNQDITSTVKKQKLVITFCNTLFTDRPFSLCSSSKVRTKLTAKKIWRMRTLGRRGWVN